MRGKGWRALLALPWRLWRALRQARAVVRRVRPDVLIGMGGYVTVPGALAGALCGKPLVLHEQNSVAGLSNRLLARLARRVFTAFPGTLPRGEWVDNPLRSAFLQVPPPAERFAGRSGPLRLLVVGGSLGAKTLNNIRLGQDPDQFQGRRLRVPRSPNRCVPPLPHRKKNEEAHRSTLHV